MISVWHDEKFNSQMENIKEQNIFILKVIKVRLISN